MGNNTSKTKLVNLIATCQHDLFNKTFDPNKITFDHLLLLIHYACFRGCHQILSTIIDNCRDRMFELESFTSSSSKLFAFANSEAPDIPFPTDAKNSIEWVITGYFYTMNHNVNEFESTRQDYCTCITILMDIGPGYIFRSLVEYYQNQIKSYDDNFLLLITVIDKMGELGQNHKAIIIDCTHCLLEKRMTNALRYYIARQKDMTSIIDRNINDIIECIYDDDSMSIFNDILYRALGKNILSLYATSDLVELFVKAGNIYGLEYMESQYDDYSIIYPTNTDLYENCLGKAIRHNRPEILTRFIKFFAEKSMQVLMLYLCNETAKLVPLSQAILYDYSDCAKILVADDKIFCAFLQAYAVRKNTLIFLSEGKKCYNIITKRMTEVFDMVDADTKDFIIADKSWGLYNGNPDYILDTEVILVRHNFNAALEAEITIAILILLLAKIKSGSIKPMQTFMLKFNDTEGSGPTQEWLLRSYDMLTSGKNSLYNIDDDNDDNKSLYIKYHAELTDWNKTSMEILGMVVAVLGMKYFANFTLCPAFYSYLCNSAAMCKTYKKSFQKSLQRLTLFVSASMVEQLNNMYNNMSNEEIETCEINMVVRCGKGDSYELIPDGTNFIIKNKQDLTVYVNAVVNFYTQRGYRRELLNHFARGFNSYCKISPVAKIMSHVEIKHLLCATYKVTKEDFLQNVTIEYGDIPDDQKDGQKMNVVNAIGLMSMGTFDRLMSFMGVGNIFKGSLKSNGGGKCFEVLIMGYKLIAPTANTCFWRLTVGVSDGAEELIERIQYSLDHEVDGFQFV